MKFNRKTIMTIFLLFLFSGSILITAANVLMQPKPEDTSEMVVMETSLGTIEIELNREKAPITVENFANYVNEGFFDGLCFHRVLNGPNLFVIQGGGFEANGTMKTPQEPIENESDNGLSNVEGTISMARTTDPDSATSQFFINVNDNAFLDYQGPNRTGYTVFGKVVKGMDVVREIAAVNTDIHEAYFPDYDFTTEFEDWPIEPVVIIKATVE